MNRLALALALCSCALLAACATTPQTAPESAPESIQQTAPPPAFTVGDSQIPDVELQRLHYALESVTSLAKRWPWLSADETCIVLTRLEAQYLLGCTPGADMPYEATTGTFRGAPIFVNRSGLAVLGPQSAPNEQFARVMVGTVIVYHENAEALTGFAREKPWIFVTGLDALVAAHPAFDESTRTEEWLAIFMHEFFHTRQALQPGIRDLWGSIYAQQLSPVPLISLYQSNEDFKAAIDAEHELLSAAAAANPDADQARAALTRWLDMRQQRIETFQDAYAGQSLDHDETAFLYIEGVARYVENTFMVDKTLHTHATPLADPQFSAFASSLGQGYAGMWAKNIPQGKYFYSHGLHLGLLLDAIDPDWTLRVHQNPTWLLGEAERAIAHQE